MRKLQFAGIAAWLALGLSACTSLRAPDGTPDPAKACAEWRWIGISRPEARCPEVRGWTVRPLFPQLAPVKNASGEYCPQPVSAKTKADELKTPGPGLIRELNRFCVYEIADPKKGLKNLPFPPAGGTDLVRFDRDCAALALSEKYTNAKEGDVDEKDLIVQVGKLETPLEIDKQLGVRLAFLDTEPTGVGLSAPEKRGNSPHGRTLVELARQLVCTKAREEPKERCAAQITTRLALPLLTFDAANPKNNEIAPTRGGYFGMQSHLAQAIRDEVDDWRAESSQQHLVLSLSMAWDGNLFGGLKEEQVGDLRAGTQAVYRALQYAAGFDVLVLAAAGNQKREPCVNHGPLLPAAWERDAPRDESCHKPGAPLLYAVGGLQADGRYLANARPGGMPRRAAYGETPLFAGSSVATAVASSIAAVVWNAFPELSSREVMDILDRKRLDATVPANQPAYTADFWFSSDISSPEPAPEVRRLSLCDALKDACDRYTSTSCPMECLERTEAERTEAEKPAVAAKGSCEPWVFPQPEDDPCPACIKPPVVQ